MSSRSPSHEGTTRQQRMAARSLGKKVTPIAKVAPAQQKEAPPVQISRACAVLGCDEYKHLPNHAFFRFPEETSLRNVWTEVTGRSNWTPNDYSFVCRVHFTSDCVRRADGLTALEGGSVPTLKLPHHVMQVEYVDEDILDKEISPKEIYQDFEAQLELEPSTSRSPRADDKAETTKNVELVKLFNEVKIKQKRLASVSKRIQHDKRMLGLRNRDVKKLREKVVQKERLLEKKARPNSPVDELDKDSLLLMPTRYSEQAKTFALNIYNYSPEAYIYLRNTLRTMLPPTSVLQSWTEQGFKPESVMSNADCLKVVTEMKQSELFCSVTVL